MNVKEIYPSSEGDVTLIRPLKDVIIEYQDRASNHRYVYASKQAVIDDILACPCMSLTDEPTGKTVDGIKYNESKHPIDN